MFLMPEREEDGCMTVCHKVLI